ncbi:MAG: MBL fold metallo-hydrolase [Gammaproteobacteria bacterium]|nr:MBL fold metallo-hydrolase [Gammaproteobacteria bacterium]
MTISKRIRTCLLLISSFLAGLVNAQNPSAFYIANEGVMVSDGETKILFDPLFPNTYGQYLLPPEEMKAAMFAGEIPFDGVDAIFISHYHGDHFSPEEIYQLMEAQPGIQLYAPNQAIIAMRSAAGDSGSAVFGRVNSVILAFDDAPVRFTENDLLVEAVRIPHSGYPMRMMDVENIAWRVTLNNNSTVLHLGDADPRDDHFANDAEYWDERTPHMAFPPYWFLSTAAGRDILDNRIKALRNVGVHVPDTIPTDPIQRPPELRGQDIFLTPGETRPIPAN